MKSFLLEYSSALFTWNGRRTFFFLKKRAFTLIELLIVVGIVAILAGIVVIAVNPAKQFAEAHNAERRVEIKKLMDALNQYVIDNRGSIGGLLPEGYAEGDVLSIVAGNTLNEDEIDLSILVPTYLAPELPFDPLAEGEYDTGYDFLIDEEDMLTISAPMAELEVSIIVATRAS